MKSATLYVLTEGNREARLRLEGHVFYGHSPRTCAVTP
jgi:hypothetical protein